ncbi:MULTISPECIES: hypothetical protein [unclassified Bradyrhizobium]|nr:MULTISPECIES: hypothetical protein [unclassified Bradyrhizobium]
MNARSSVRSRFEQRFSARRMAREYEGEYLVATAAGEFNMQRSET